MIDFALRDGRSLRVLESQPEDAPALIDYLNRVGGASDFLTFGANEFWLSIDQEESFLRGMQPNIGWMLKGIIDNRIVATLSLLRTDRPRLKHIAELGVSVLKDYWGLGVGRSICRVAIDLAAKGGVHKINLKVREDNTRAIELYEKLGFKIEGLSPRAALLRGEYFSEVLMGLCLECL